MKVQPENAADSGTQASPPKSRAVAATPSCKPMSEAWLRPVEQIVLSAGEKKHRVLGFISPGDGARVSALSLTVAESFARTGMSTLLVDLTEPVRPVENNGMSPWSPGDAGVGQAIVRDDRVFDRLVAHPTSESRYRFNNVEILRHTLVTDLCRYTRIVLNLPAVAQADDDCLNPAGPAAACDAVYIVGMTDRSSRDQLVTAAQQLRSAGVLIGGVILDDAHRVRLGEEIALSAIRWLGVAPRLAAWTAAKARASPFLN